MNKMLSPRPVILLLPFVLFLSACIPDSRHPLPPPADGEGDDRLIGRWIAADEGERGYAEVTSAGGGRYHVRMVSFDDDGPDAGTIDESAMDVVTTRIGGRWFMTVTSFSKPEEGGPEESRYLIARYDITAQGEWLIYLMGWEPLAEDVRAGRVAGEVKPAEMWEDVLLTADSEALAAYIAAADPERIFAGHPLHMRRP
jgi:hypothetical protein